MQRVDARATAEVIARAGPGALAASGAAAILITAFAWNLGHGMATLAWLTAVLGVAAHRFVMFAAYRRQVAAANVDTYQHWVKRFDRSITLNGAVWGIGGIIFGLIPDFLTHVLFALCLCGLFAGTIASYFAHLRAAFAFAVPALTPFSMFMLTHGPREDMVLGGCILMFFGIGSIIAVQVSDSLELSLPQDTPAPTPGAGRALENLEQRRVEHLYRAAVLTSTGALLGAAVLIYILRAELDLVRSAWWFTALVGAAGLRLKKVAQYRRDSEHEARPGYWLTNFNYPLVIVGLAWSTGAIALAETTLAEMLMMMCIFGLVSGAVASFSSHPSAVLSLAVPAVLPFSIYLIVADHGVSQLLGIALLVFSTLQVMAGARAGRIVREGLVHELDNERLIGRLTEQVDVNAELNNQLETRVKLRTEELNLLVGELSERSQELARSRKQYRDIVEYTRELIQSTDGSGRILFANDAWKNELGYDDDDLRRGLNVAALIAPQHRDNCASLFSAKAPRESVTDTEFSVTAKDGRRVDLAGRVYAGFDESADDATFAIFTNVTEANAADAALQSSEARFQAIFARSSLGILIVSPDLTIIDANPCAHAILGHSLDTLCGNALRTIVGPQQRATLEQQLRAFITSGESSLSLEIACTRGGQEPFWAELDFSAIKDSDGRARFLAVIVQDVSQRKALADVLEHNASHDYLTGLINRREFEHRLGEYLASASPQAPHALAYFDLDRFKLINDTCGHSTGDALLRVLSDTLAAVVPPDCDLARIGGDEFGLLIPATSIGEADIVTRALVGAVENFRFEHEGRIHTIGVSAGVVLIRGDESISDAMQSADAACYAAKRSGRNRIEFYDINRTEMRLQRDQIRAAAQLANALKEDRLRLYAQPIAVCGQSRPGPIVRYELLLRILDENGRITGPGELLPAAEKYGYANEVDQWVVRNALAALAQYESDTGFNLKLSINLSAQSLLSSQFEDFLADQLRTHPFSSMLCFEITENEFMSNFERATSFMQRMHRMGCQFALDDFGTGFSSYGYLKSLELDFLKIDGTFVRNIDSNPVDRAIVNSIVDVARAIKMTTIAEYVERDAQAEILREIGVDMLQGYAIGREMPLTEVLGKHSSRSA